MTIDTGGTTKSNFFMKLEVTEFMNPFSTTKISSMEGRITSSGTVTFEHTTQTISGFTPRAMTSAALTPGNMEVGATGTTVTISGGKTQR